MGQHPQLHHVQATVPAGDVRSRVFPVPGQACRRSSIQIYRRVQTINGLEIGDRTQPRTWLDSDAVILSRGTARVPAGPICLCPAGRSKSSAGERVLSKGFGDSCA